MKRRLLFYILPFLFYQFLHADIYKPQIDHINTDEGLSHSNVVKIIQDDAGFMWFATQDGLNKYDGHRVINFRAGEGSSPLLKRSVKYIYKDSQGRLWIWFDTGGISVYNPVLEKFKHFISDSLNSQTLSNDRIYSRGHSFGGLPICEDENDNIWFATQNGLNKYNQRKNMFAVYFKETVNSLKSNQISAIKYDKKNKLLWIGTAENLAVYDYYTDSIYDVETLATDQSRLSETPVSTLFIDNAGDMWAGTYSSGVNHITLQRKEGKISCKIASYLYNKASNPLERNNSILTIHQHDETNELWFGGSQGIYRTILKNTGLHVLDHMGNPKIDKHKIDNIRKIISDSKGDVWAGGNGSEYGLIHFSYKDSVFQYVNHEPGNSGSLSINAITDLMEDRHGVLWISTVKGGINKIDLYAKKFRHLKHNPLDKNTINSDDVYCITQTPNRHIWIGTIQGLNHLDENLNLIERFNKPEFNNNKTIAGEIAGVLEPGENHLWLGYFDYKMSKYHYNSKKFSHFSYDPYNDNRFKPWSLRDLYLDNDTLYIAATSHGLTIYDILNNNFKYINKEDGLSSNWIYSIHRDQTGIFWLGTKNGLNKYDPASGKITVFNTRQINPAHKLSNDEIKVIHEDENNILWIGTGGGGVIRFNKHNEVKKVYTTAQGLCNNTIHSILEDNNDQLWISTSYGLARFNKTAEKFRNYFIEDGICNNEFNEGAGFLSDQGIMYFGGVKGVTYFKPDEIVRNPFVPSVYLTGFELFNDLIKPQENNAYDFRLDSSISIKQNLNLHFDENIFTLHFSSDHYSAPEKLNYQYRLVGFEEEWHMVGGSNLSATYTNLNPGEYFFDVRVTFNGIDWSNIRRLKIAVHPPWYNTLSFKIFLIGLLIASLFVFNWYRTRSLIKRQMKLKEMVEDQTEELLRKNDLLQKRQEQILEQNAEIEHQNRNISSLNEMGKQITSSIKPGEFIKNLYSTVNKLVDAYVFNIGQVDEEQGYIELWEYPSPDVPLTNYSIPLAHEDNPVVQCYRKKESIVCQNNQSPQSMMQNPGEDKNVSSAIYLPLKSVSDKVIGVMTLKSIYNEVYNTREQKMLENLAAFIGIALDNAIVYGQLEQQSKILHEADEMKTRFFTNISHEFKTPLSLILAPVDELLDNKNLEFASRQLLYLIQKNAGRLNRLVIQLTDLTRVEQGVLPLKVCEGNIFEVLNSIAQSFEYIARKNKINYRYFFENVDIHAFFDEDKIEKIAYNLIQNAFTHSEEHATIVVVGEMDSHEKKLLKFKVTNTGKQIPDTEIGNIFKPFYQVSEQDNMQTSGMGIGLSLAKKLIELHKGNISVRSWPDPEKNTGVNEFLVQIPLNKKTYDEQEIHHIITAQKAKKTPSNPDLTVDSAHSVLNIDKFKEDCFNVLIVEDNKDLLTFLNNKLSKKFNVLLAENGKDALVKIQYFKPDLIITDVMMPEADGFELVKQVKSNKLHSHIPVIMLTACSGQQAIAKGYSLGADDYISKPFNIVVLENKIQNILETRYRLIEKYDKNLSIHLKDLSEDDDEKKFLARLSEILEDNLSNDAFTTEEFIRLTGMSRTHFFERVKRLTGKTVNELIWTYRLKSAAKILENKPSVRTKELAFNVGISNPKYFAQMFKKYFGKTPSQFIKDVR